MCQATLRPEMDWSMDAKLPQRFKVWKRRVTSELRLQMAAYHRKQQLWACTYVIVCAEKQGENVIQQAKLLEEKEDSLNYFYPTERCQCHTVKQPQNS